MVGWKRLRDVVGRRCHSDDIHHQRLPLPIVAQLDSLPPPLLIFDDAIQLDQHHHTSYPHHHHRYHHLPTSSNPYINPSLDSLISPTYHPHLPNPTMPAISFLPFLQTVPFGTRLLTFSLIFLTISSFLIRGIASRHPDQDGQIPWQDLPWLVMVPGKSFKYPWTLLISGWIEINPIEVRETVVMS